MKVVLIIIYAAALMVSCRNRSGQTTTATDSMATFNDSLAATGDIDSMNAIKNREDYMRRTDYHIMLAAWVGEWTGKGTLWRMPDTGAVFSQIKETNTMEMGGRYLISHQTGTIQDSTFEGMNILGYDNAKKLFVSTWVDNFGTGLAKLEGVWNDKKNQLELKGKMIDPASGKEVDTKENIR